MRTVRGRRSITALVRRRAGRLPPIRRGGHIRSFAQTDPGLDRASNQDVAYVRSDGDSELLVVADGMGGAPAGEVASLLVVEAFERRPERGVEPLAYLKQAVEEARRAISSSVAEHPEHEGMGSTVAAAFVRDGRVWAVNVGDSRAYLWRAGELRQLSEDHSVAAQGVRDGWIDREMVRFDPQRHMLTRVIGGMTTADQSPTYSCESAELDGSSTVLLVTDGVSGVISDEELKASIEQHRGPDLARELIRRVHEAGAPDNIGIAIFDERA